MVRIKIFFTYTLFVLLCSSCNFGRSEPADANKSNASPGGTPALQSGLPSSQSGSSLKAAAAKDTAGVQETDSKQEDNAATPADGKAVTELFPEIAGRYRSKQTEEGSSPCDAEVAITADKGKYFYRLSIGDKIFKGKVTVHKADEPKKRVVIFEGIKWAEYDGDISNEEEDHPKMELPVGVGGSFTDNEIMIQNYGNASNHYLVFAECDVKYIELVKQ